jgi:hypothetical protein
MGMELFNKWKGHNRIPGAEKDKFGNAQGHEYDLVKNNAFAGLGIAVLHLYTLEGFDFELPKKALERKGFRLIYWKDKLPPIKDFKEALKSCSQLWIISNLTAYLTEEYLGEIDAFFQQGKGLYLWGDNDPYYADANKVAKKLWGIELSGNYSGDKVIGIQKQPNSAGLIAGHEISTGIENIYEGHTVAMIAKSSNDLTPLIYGSNNKIIASFCDKGGKRAIIDGGFTRLYCKWDSAGTERYVVNAAAWLVNYERFAAKKQFQQDTQNKIAMSPRSIIDKF